MELILAIALLIIWGSVGISLLLSTIQGLIYDKKREKRDLEYHVQFTASSGRHSVLERPFSEANGRPFVS